MPPKEVIIGYTILFSLVVLTVATLYFTGRYSFVECVLPALGMALGYLAGILLHVFRKD